MGDLLVAQHALGACHLLTCHRIVTVFANTIVMIGREPAAQTFKSMTRRRSSSRSRS